MCYCQGDCISPRQCFGNEIPPYLQDLQNRLDAAGVESEDQLRHQTVRLNGQHASPTVIVPRTQQEERAAAPWFLLGNLPERTDPNSQTAIKLALCLTTGGYLLGGDIGTLSIGAAVGMMVMLILQWKEPQ
jgi:hypothetical protein